MSAAIPAVWMLMHFCAGAPAPLPLPEDPPVTTRPSRGSVRGRIRPAERIARVYAVNRVTGSRYAPSRFDAKTGEFAFEGLPGDATYDLGIVTSEAARIEGIDLAWHEARLLRLARLRREQLGLPAPRPHEFTAGDARELLRYVKDLKDFTDVRRVLYVQADGPRATMLVEVMRVRDFYAKAGDQMIWRMELWYFRYRYGGWERLANVERVLERHRISAAKWRGTTLVYLPRLSVYVDEAGHSQRVDFRIPAKLDPAWGRIADTEPVQPTKPIILTPTNLPAKLPARPASGDRDRQIQLDGGVER